MATRSFDPVMFQLTGCSPVTLDPDVLAQTRSAVSAETWSDVLSEGVELATWSNRDTLNPPQYRPLLDHLDQLTEQIFGQGYRRHMLSMWRGSEALTWHNHVDDNELREFHWIVYLGSDDWCDEAGGLLQVKNRMMDEVVTFQPSYGTAVLLNNTHPDFVHQVTSFTPIRVRIIFQVGYEYVR